jgi:2-polyprenyl-6-hydroxyphenyl methylase/3-demethylubiquinone-9 3-methyltransferase
MSALRAHRANVTSLLRDRAAAAGLIKYKQGVWAGVNGAYADQYERGYWDYLKGIDQVGGYSMIVGYVDFFSCRSILDVGCGNGVMRSRLERVAFERYVGIDPVAAGIAIAQQYADVRTEFMVGDVFLPQLGSFDAVVCCEVLYHIPELEAALDRIRVLVNPGGYLLTSHLSHPRDAGLYRMLNERFELVSAYDLRNDTARGIRQRKVAAYRRTA